MEPNCYQYPKSKVLLYGTLIKPIVPGEKYSLEIELKEPSTFILKYGFSNSYTPNSKEDTLEAFKNTVLKDHLVLNQKRIRIENVMPEDTSIFIVLSAETDCYESTWNKSVLIKSISLVSNQKLNLSLYYLSPRIRFILSDTRRHFFESTDKSKTLMNRIEFY